MGRSVEQNQLSRQTDRQRPTDRDRQIQIQTDGRQRETDRQPVTDRDRRRQTDRQTQKPGVQPSLLVFTFFSTVSDDIVIWHIEK